MSGGDPGRIIQCRRVNEPPADTPARGENVQIPHRWGEVSHERREAREQITVPDSDGRIRGARLDSVLLASHDIPLRAETHRESWVSYQDA